MSSRFAFPHAYDPQMHREEALTLSRSVSQRNGTNMPNVTSSQPGSTMEASKVNGYHTAQRGHFVFADPVAFRYVFVVCPELAILLD